MSKQLLVRNVPDPICEWMERERQEHGVTQQEFVLSVLRAVWEKREAVRFPLFATLPVQPERLQPVDPSIPFSFVDLFAGIGGFRVALERLGGNCVYSCERDKYARRTYAAWFGHKPESEDIRSVKPSEIPDHDILAAGFPCQPFSIAGVSKKKSLGRPHGFKCEDQGNLFFILATIIESKRPPAVFLENVKNLLSHDGGRTWRVIQDTLEQMNYWVFSKVIDAAGWVPQHRERMCIVCFDKEKFREKPPFEFPEPPLDGRPKLVDILEKDPASKYTLSDHLWAYLRSYAERHREKGNGFGYGIPDPNGITRTLSARYYKDGSEILIAQAGGSPRRLTPSECARLMGFNPDNYKIVVSDTQAYRQFGNAVVPLVVEAVAQQILKVFAWRLMQTKNGCLLKTNRKTA